jgi:hypothetical protein
VFRDKVAPDKVYEEESWSFPSMKISAYDTLDPGGKPTTVKLSVVPSGEGVTTYACLVELLLEDRPRVRLPPRETGPPPVRGLFVLIVRDCPTDEGVG